MARYVFVGPVERLFAVVAGVQPAVRILGAAHHDRRLGDRRRVKHRVRRDGEDRDVLTMPDVVLDYSCFVTLGHAGRTLPSAL